ncbi:MAG: hypothetical protein U1F36_14490 [Planctomycetota bacterium]
MKAITFLVSLALCAGAAIAQTATFTNFGRPCGGDLNGSQVRGPAVQMDVTNAAPGSYAILCVGQQQRPVALPGSNCYLVVNPRITLNTQVDRAGNASFLLRLPNMPINVDMQVVTVALSRNGRTAESTNGVNLVWR